MVDKKGNPTAVILSKRIQKDAFHPGRSRGSQRKQDPFSILGIQKTDLSCVATRSGGIDAVSMIDSNP